MGINTYAKKYYEDEHCVIYNYGSIINDLTGKIKFNKDPFELIIIEKEKGVNRSRELFKIATKIKNIYKETGDFPNKASSAS